MQVIKWTEMKNILKKDPYKSVSKKKNKLAMSKYWMKISDKEDNFWTISCNLS